MDKEKIQKETELIRQLESVDCSKMTATEAAIHRQKIKDAYWRRRFQKETELICQLESVDCSKMTATEAAIHWQKIKDAYWRRRMASRTSDEVARNVCAPG